MNSSWTFPNSLSHTAPSTVSPRIIAANNRPTGRHKSTISQAEFTGGGPIVALCHPPRLRWQPCVADSLTRSVVLVSLSRTELAPSEAVMRSIIQVPSPYLNLNPLLSSALSTLIPVRIFPWTNTV